MIGAIKAAVVIAVRLPVEEPQTLIVEAGTDVIEDEVEQDCHTREMENIDDAFQLVRSRPELIDLQRLDTVPREESINLLEIAGEFGIIRGI